MTTPLPPDLIQRGFDSTATRQRDEARAALAATQRHLADAVASLAAGKPDTRAFRMLVVDAADAAQRAFAYAAVLETASFARPEDS